MYRGFMVTFNLVVDESKATEEEKAALRNGKEPLRVLCRKEVDRFDLYLRTNDHQFSEGLAPFERLVLEGYLYQKVRGHLDASQSSNDVRDGRQNV